MNVKKVLYKVFQKEGPNFHSYDYINKNLINIIISVTIALPTSKNIIIKLFKIVQAFSLFVLNIFPLMSFVSLHFIPEVTFYPFRPMKCCSVEGS